MGREQTKTIRITIDLPMKFPEDWSDHLIEFHLNESSWCFSNLIELLEEYDEEHGCLCHICKARIFKTDEENCD